MTEKGLRFDLLIAVCALLLSALAAGAATYQTYVINQQYSASVWPYLTFVTSSNSKTFITVDIQNVGIGPALIRAAAITRDGNVMHDAPDGSMAAIGNAIAPEVKAANQDQIRLNEHGNIDTDITSVDRGDVIPAGGHLLLLKVRGAWLVKRLVADQRHIDVSLCYCSLLGQCWMRNLQNAAREPAQVRRCPEAT